MLKTKKTLAIALIATAVAVAAALVLLSRRPAAEPAAPPSHTPESYMNDGEFRKGLSERRMARERLMNGRKKVLDRMEEISRSVNGDKAALEADSEWKELKAKAAEFDNRIDEARGEMLRYVRGRLVPGAENKKGDGKP